MSNLLDVLLAMGLVALAAEVAGGRSLLRSIVLFVAFGLVMAIVWTRLGAPDLALAEAAIGAGMSGALLFVGYRRLFAHKPEVMRQPLRRPSWVAATVGALAALLVAGLGWYALSLPTAPSVTGTGVLARMPSQPIESPVTAVLLLFRGYDTLLELAVLLAALQGVRLVQGDAGPPPLAVPSHASLPVVQAMMSALVPLSVLVAGYLLHAGGKAPGGAFQGGAVLAAAGVLLVLTGRLVPERVPGAAQRLLTVAGVTTMGAVGVTLSWIESGDVGIPGAWGVYLVETAMLVSIAQTLVLLFAAAPALRLGRRH